jgi:hypothetical protein
MHENLGQRKVRHDRCGRMVLDSSFCDYCMKFDSNYREELRKITEEVDSVFHNQTLEQWRIDNVW